MTFLQNFESIGNNCEFGFFLASQGINDGGLLRWAFVNDFAKLAGAIGRKMEGSFAFDALSPFSLTMAVDGATNIAYHTKMRIEDRDGLSFTDSNDERRAIHAVEASKFAYLRDKFFAELRSGGKVYVVKCNAGIPDSDVEALSASLLAHGDATILHVRSADAQNRAGTVIRSGPNLLTGFIDRFADYSKADDISKDCWLEICGAAWRMLHPDSKIESGALTFPELVAPSGLPSGFNADDYYMANPGVKEAGMDAAEHWLNHGWKERRALRL